MKRVTVTVSEPWDFVTHDGSNVLVADVHTGGGRQGLLLLRLLEPVPWHGDDWHWFVATPTPDTSFSLHGVTESEATNDGWRTVPNAWRGQSPTARADLG